MPLKKSMHLIRTISETKFLKPYNSFPGSSSYTRELKTGPIGPLDSLVTASSSPPLLFWSSIVEKKGIKKSLNNLDKVTDLWQFQTNRNMINKKINSHR